MNKRPLLNTQEASYSSLNTKRTKLSSDNTPSTPTPTIPTTTTTTINSLNITITTSNTNNSIQYAQLTANLASLNDSAAADFLPQQHLVPIGQTSLTTPSLDDTVNDDEIIDLEQLPSHSYERIVATSSSTNKNTLVFCDDIIGVILSYLGNDFPTIVMNISLISKQWLNVVIQHSKLDINNYKHENILKIINSTFLNNVQSLEWNNSNPFLSSITKLNQLTRLTCYNINAPIIGEMRQLTELSIGQTCICEQDARYISQLSNLKTLNFWGEHKIGDNGAKHISKLTNLTSLNIANCDIHAEGAWFISQLPKLTKLEISYNVIGDDGTNHISQMKELRILNICFNSISWRGMKNIFKMKKLTHLSVCSGFHKNFGGRVSKLSKLRSLAINFRQITSKTIIGISELKHLKHLHVYEPNLLKVHQLKEQLINLKITVYDGHYHSHREDSYDEKVLDMKKRVLERDWNNTIFRSEKVLGLPTRIFEL